MTILIVWMHFTGDRLLSVINCEACGEVFTILAYALLSLTLSRFLARGSLKHTYPYRIAFFATLVMGALLSILSPMVNAAAHSWTHLLAVTLGAFLGSFIASNLDKGWWENNAQPSQHIEQEVLASHERFMKPIAKTPFTKRTSDFIFAAFSLLLSLPAWLMVIVLVWWKDPGPILFVKNSVGRGGKNFKQLKFRSMVLHAEVNTGPISGYENDERVLWFGKFLRKTALDEIPQLINILLGDMSMVGPRPQRTVLVHEYLKHLPEYANRHRVRPGLAGLAQVADAYDISPKEKLAWDLVYIQKASLWMDIKLLFSAFYLVFALRWLPGSHPEVRIRSLLKVTKPDIDDL